jgi:hypothetical protein
MSQSAQQVAEFDFSRKASPGSQGKLRINVPGDIHEQEADHVAEQVLTEPMNPGVGGTSTRIQHLATQPTAQMEPAPASVERVLANPGRPLEPTLRQDMERRFVHDFSRVRVHSGTEAEQSARDINARAYTAGQSIAFGAGEFTPETRDGRRLLAHELAHVMQQSGAEANVVRRSNGFEEVPTLMEGGSVFAPPRGLVYIGGERYFTNVASGEIVVEGSRASGLGALLIEAGLPGPWDVLLLYIGWFADLAAAKQKLSDESYLLGFCEGFSASLLWTPADWVNRHLMEKTAHPSIGERVAGFEGVRERGNNRGVREGYESADKLSGQARKAFRKYGITTAAGEGHEVSLYYNLDGIVNLGLALKPTFGEMFEVARRQEAQRQFRRGALSTISVGPMVTP